MSNGQIRSLDESGVQPSREPQALQGELKSILGSQVHHVCDLYQLAPLVAFLHLAVDQAWLHLPPAHLASSTTRGKPLAKVGGERIKVAIEPVAGKQWDAIRRQPLLESMDEPWFGCAGRVQAPEESW